VPNSRIITSDGQPGHREQAFHQRGEHRRIAAKQPARQRGDGGNQEKAQPEAIEHVHPPLSTGSDDSRVMPGG